MARKTTATKSKPRPVDEDIEDELDAEDEDELTELDEDEESETPTKSKKSKAKEDEVTFGARHLADHLSKLTGKTISPRDLRVLLRKMARSGKLDREITAGNRARYDWPAGLNDPEVKAIIKAVKGGEIEKGKKEALDALKARKAAGEVGTKKGKKATKTKAKAPVEEEDLDDEDFEDEDED